MNVDEAYRRVKFQAHPNSELGRVGGPLVDEVDSLKAEVARLREAIVAYVASEDADIWEQERTWEALCAIARATEGEP